MVPCWMLGAAVGCGEDSAGPGQEPPSDGGSGGAAGGSPDAGPLPQPCPPGQLALADGSCLPPGVPAEGCGEGFTPTGDGSCAPILPPGPCAPGTMAIPGEETCRDVAPCGAGTWGDIPTDGTTQFVDATYPGGDSDGSQPKPWLTVQDGIDGAAPGAVVAVAAGTYTENLTIDQALQLWGRCPAQVTVSGATPSPTVTIMPSADGVEVHDLAVTGPGAGVVVVGSDEVRLARLWIHDTDGGGIQAQTGGASPTGVELVDSLLETATTTGIFIGGATVTVDRSVVRDTRASTSGHEGRGLYVTDHSGDGTRSELLLRRSVVERNHTCGVFAWGSDVTLQDGVVRDTLAQATDDLFGNGVMVFRNETTGARAQLVTTGTVITGNRGGGVTAVDSELRLERSVVQDTASRQADGRDGDGVVILGSEPTEPLRPVAEIVASVVERNHRFGVVASGAELTIESTIVRDTVGQVVDDRGGNGVYAESSHLTGQAATFSVLGSLIGGNRSAAVLVLGSSVDIDQTWIRDTSPCAATGRFGRGLDLEVDGETLLPASGTLRRSLVEGAHEAAVFALGAELTVENVTIRATLPQPATGLYGDGLLMLDHPQLSGPVPTTATVHRGAIHGCARAGVANLGAQVTIGATDLQCNAIDLDGEVVVGAPFEFLDEGGNACGCAGTPHPCQVLSTDLGAPDPIDP